MKKAKRLQGTPFTTYVLEDEEPYFIKEGAVVTPRDFKRPRDPGPLTRLASWVRRVCLGDEA